MGKRANNESYANSLTAPTPAAYPSKNPAEAIERLLARCDTVADHRDTFIFALRCGLSDGAARFVLDFPRGKMLAAMAGSR
jgi:hypothetical protein